MTRTSKPSNPKGLHKPTLAERHAQFRKRRESTGFDWTMIDARLWAMTVATVTAGGAAIMCSATQGGRAISMTILDGEERVREYAALPEEFTEICHHFIGLYASDSEDVYMVWNIEFVG